MGRQILLFTDFGAQGPYMGQMHSALYEHGAKVPVVAVQDDAPVGDPRRSGYLLAALVERGSHEGVWVCVVDPGVGTARRALAVRTDSRWLIGPDNGLLVPAIKAGRDREIRAIDWMPERLSNSFHGRDLFAPVAARISRGEVVDSSVLNEAQLVGWDWPRDLREIVYIDRFGNAMTGIRASPRLANGRFQVGEYRLRRACTFAEVPEGQPFWYVNSLGLVEIAVNRGRADALLGLGIGSSVRYEIA